jgi:hypothetical protein
MSKHLVEQHWLSPDCGDRPRCLRARHFTLVPHRGLTVYQRDELKKHKFTVFRAKYLCSGACCKYRDTEDLQVGTQGDDNKTKGDDGTRNGTKSYDSDSAEESGCGNGEL